MDGPQADFKQFYEGRYAHGYMETWPNEKKRRIIGIIGSLRLPTKGFALDFGCGNGVLTSVLRDALPKTWTICGVDISERAIQNARARYPECSFHVASDDWGGERKFDLVFTHHVLEHVGNLSDTVAEINRYAREASTMLHILPCGNEGSFEHSVCLLRRDGIDPRLENRWFFEDEGHVRRLTTEQLSESFRRHGFDLAAEYYSNQHDGAVDWITESGPRFMRTFTDTRQAKNRAAQRRLRQLGRKLWLLWGLRYPAAFMEARLKKQPKRVVDYFLVLLALPLYVLAKPTDWYLRRRANLEWQHRCNDRRGSEMYLLLRRA
jgi:trans-aconitate methyltransferase